MEISEIKDLMRAFDESGLSSLEIEEGNLKLRLGKGAGLATQAAATPVIATQPTATEVPAPASATEAAAQTVDDRNLVKAPLVGVFYAAASPEAEAYVQVGSQVKAGQVLCLIEAMKMMSEITAPRDGVIKKIFVKNQDVVGFEDPLFEIGD